MVISERIKAIAKKHGKTVSSMAQEMGVAQQHLSRTINNPRITLQDMEKIAQHIGCDVADFFVQDDAPPFICPHCGKPIKITLE